MLSTPTPTERETFDLCIKFGIKTFWNEVTIHEDGSVDVTKAHVGINNYDLTEIPVQFNSVSHNFLCECNELTSLKGCPKTVGQDFSCAFNKISTLHYCPILTPGYNYCFNHNNLPEIVMEKLLYPDNHDMINLFVKYQDLYDVWENGFNLQGFNNLMSDINEGLDNWQRTEVVRVMPDYLLNFFNETIPMPTPPQDTQFTYNINR